MGFDIAFLYAMKGFRTLAYDAAQAAMDSLPTGANKPSTACKSAIAFRTARSTICEHFSCRPTVSRRWRKPT